MTSKNTSNLKGLFAQIEISMQALVTFPFHVAILVKIEAFCAKEYNIKKREKRRG